MRPALAIGALDVVTAVEEARRGLALFAEDPRDGLAVSGIAAMSEDFEGELREGLGRAAGDLHQW